MLILTKAPPPKRLGVRAEGMMPDSPLAPGQPPPWIMPHCRKCGIVVETFTIDWVASPFYLPIQFTCHGKTGGMKVPASEVLWKSKNGGIIWVFDETKVSHAKR